MEGEVALAFEPAAGVLNTVTVMIADTVSANAVSGATIQPLCLRKEPSQVSQLLLQSTRPQQLSSHRAHLPILERPVYIAGHCR